MATYEGEIRYEDLEGGLWLLVTSSGQRLQLQGGDPSLRKEGQAVTVVGKVAEEMMGIGMTGPILQVQSWKAR